jgi:hypothetical protein
MRTIIEAAGFSVLEWSEVRIERPPSGAPRPAHTVQSLVMGDDRVAEIMRASRRNEDEGRTTLVHAVFTA